MIAASSASTHPMPVAKVPSYNNQNCLQTLKLSPGEKNCPQVRTTAARGKEGAFLNQLASEVPFISLLFHLFLHSTDIFRSWVWELGDSSDSCFVILGKSYKPPSFTCKTLPDFSLVPWLAMGRVHLGTELLNSRLYA